MKTIKTAAPIFTITSVFLLVFLFLVNASILYSSNTDQDDDPIDFEVLGYNLDWVQTYDGPSNDWDQSLDIAVDSSGNIFVTGPATNSHTDFATIKYLNDGTQDWLTPYTGPGESDNAKFIELDGLGNIYVAGDSQKADGTFDYLVVKYNASGVEQWTWRYPSEISGADAFTADIAIDDDENILITGTTEVTSNDHLCYLTAKINSSGSEVWSESTCADTGDAVAVAMDVDSNNDVYVTGYYFFEDGVYSHWRTTQISSSGSTTYTKDFIGSNYALDRPYDCAVEKSTGNLYITGVTHPNGYNSEFTTAKYSVSGSQEWSIGYIPSQNVYSSVGLKIKVDHQGSAYLSGIIRRDAGTYPFNRYFYIHTLKYNLYGTILWNSEYGYTSTTTTYTIQDLFVDDLDRIHVLATKSSQYMLNLALTDEGEIFWEDTFSAAGYDKINASKGAIDSSGNLYATGYAIDGSTSDFLTLKFERETACDDCLIGVVCYEDSEINPKNPCQVCDVGVSTSEWTNKADGIACDDNLYCNGDDTCLEGTCQVHVNPPCPDDNIFCNGDEICDDNERTCTHTGDPCEDDGFWCTGNESCDTELDECVHQYSGNERCPDDGFFCNGSEFCSEDADMCMHDGTPCTDDGLWCNGDESCDEESNSCVHQYSGNDRCPNDDQYCNGDEECDEVADTCVSAGNPCPDDGMFCNGTERCDEDNDQCFEPVDACEDDGLWCNGIESCDEAADVCDTTGNPCTEEEICDELDDKCIPRGDDDDTGDDDTGDDDTAGDDDTTSDDDDDSNPSASRGNDEDDDSCGCTT